MVPNRPLIRLAFPKVSEEGLSAVQEIFKTGILTKGPRVECFEQACAATLGIRHAVAVSSGTAALHLACLALGLRAPDEVLVPDFTFPASANAVEHTGARPVLVDIDLSSYNVKPGEMARGITPRTKAIMAVHQFGCPAPMDEIMALARQHHLAVIEDAACAFGALYRGKPCGSLGTIGCFSFHPRKIITTGEGGLIATNDAAVAHRCRLLRDHGQIENPAGIAFVAAGYNYRLSELHSAVGLAQLPHLDQFIARRQTLARLYQERLGHLSRIRLPFEPADVRHVYQSYVVLLRDGIDRSRVIASLREAEIESAPGNYAVHAQPYYGGKYGHRPGDIVQSWLASQQALALPLHSAMADAEAAQVADALVHALEDQT